MIRTTDSGGQDERKIAHGETTVQPLARRLMGEDHLHPTITVGHEEEVDTTIIGAMSQTLAATAAVATKRESLEGACQQAMGAPSLDQEEGAMLALL